MFQNLLFRAARAVLACLTAGAVLTVGIAPALATSPFLVTVDAPKQVAVNALIHWDLKVPAGLKSGTSVIFRLEGEADGEITTSSHEGNTVHANGMMSVAPSANRRIFRVMRTLRQEAVIRMTGRYRKVGTGSVTVGAYVSTKIDGRWQYTVDRKIEPFFHHLTVIGDASPFCAAPVSNGGSGGHQEWNGLDRTTLTVRATQLNHMGEKMTDLIARAEMRVAGPLTIVALTAQNSGVPFNTSQHGGLLQPNDNATWGGLGLGLQDGGSNWYAAGSVTGVMAHDFEGKVALIPPTWSVQSNLDLAYSWNDGMQRVSFESQGGLGGDGSIALRSLLRGQPYRFGWFAPQLGVMGMYFHASSNGAEGAMFAPGAGFRLGTNRLAWDVFAGGTPSGPSLTSGITARF